MKLTKLLAAVACLIILNLVLVSASCTKDQVNINEASKTELQKIDQVGPTYAGRIIDLRPFESLDGLTEVKGIAEGRLETINNQNLACVEASSSKNQSTDEESDEETPEDKEESPNEETNEEKTKNNEPEVSLKQTSQEETSEENQPNTQQDKITLSAKDIKNQTANDGGVDKSKYSQYGLVGLTILVILLFLLREVKHRKYKNEFSG